MTPIRAFAARALATSAPPMAACLLAVAPIGMIATGLVPAALAQGAPAPAGKPKPADVKPADAKPTDAKPADARPADAKPTDAKPADARPAEAKPGGALLEPVVSDAKAVWPNGARSVSEAYGDWSMNCTKENEQVDCVVIQSQGDRRTGRRQFSIELRVPAQDRAEGLILMPFGMQIESGVTFKLDDRALGKGAPYSYCVSDGCLVPISLPTLATDTMKTAQSLTVSAMKPDAKEPTVISVPLAGFAAAFARAIALGR